MKNLYLKFLQYLCRKELKTIANEYPQSRGTLIRYYDLLAIECINAETKSKDRLLGICLSTATMLEKTTADS